VIVFKIIKNPVIEIYDGSIKFGKYNYFTHLSYQVHYCGSYKLNPEVDSYCSFILVHFQKLFKLFFFAFIL